MSRRSQFLLLSALLCFSCSKKEDGPSFVTEPVEYSLPAQLTEISGMATRTGSTDIWVEMDSGNPNSIYQLDNKGMLKHTTVIKGVANRDWEDICTANGKIYLAETGDNNQVYPESSIIIFNETAALQDTVSNATVLKFHYPDAPHDVEAIMVDPQTQEIFLITKRDARSILFKLTDPSTGGLNQVAVKLGELPYNFVTAAAMQNGSSDEMLVRTYSNIYYYKRAGRSMAETLAGSYENLSYKADPQGESICFAADNKGYYTASESLGAPVSLKYYARR